MRCFLPGLTITLWVTFFAGCTGQPPAEANETSSIRGVLLDAYLQSPVAGAEVVLRAGGPRITTDDDGVFVFDDVSAGSHYVVFSAEDYMPGARANVIVEPGMETTVTARVFQLDPPLSLQEQWLHRAPRPELPEEPHGQLHEVDGEIAGEIGRAVAALDAPLPTTIRVWRSQGTSLAPSASNGWADRSCSGNVQVLPFEEYVKGVIPHEWIPSWHTEALRAGAIAARSYAASHALGGGRWDCADVDDGTVTQVYRDDRAAATSQAVDDTRGMVVVRSGRVVRTEYSAENAHPTASDGVQDPVCSGAPRNGHGRGACQWGTQRWATGTCYREPCGFGSFGSAPKDHAWMMQHYFPGSVLEGGTPAGPCAVVGAEGGVIDDSGPCFAAIGPAEYWRTQSGSGHGGSLHWTNAFSASTPSNWARWDIHMAEAGEYRVEVNIVDAYAEYGAARYEVRAGGTDQIVILDQGASGDGWVELGTFTFAAGGDQRVSLFDNYSGTVPSDQHLVADAIRLVSPEEPTPPVIPPVDAGMIDPGPAKPSGDAGVWEPGGDASTFVPGDPKDGELSGCSAGSGRSATNLMWIALGGLALFIRRRSHGGVS